MSELLANLFRTNVGNDEATTAAQPPLETPD